MDCHADAYERPTLWALGSFRDETGRFFVGFFADGTGGWQWSGLS